MIKRKRLIWQLYPSYLVLVLIAVLATGWYASRAMRGYIRYQTHQDLLHQSHLLTEYFTPMFSSFNPPLLDQQCKRLGLGIPTRITLILPDGRVVADSEAETVQMENHADRPEIQSAFKGRTGSSTRFSNTLKQEMIYVAVPLRMEDRVVGVVRVSLAISAIDRQLSDLQMRLAFGGLVVAALAALICLVISRRISRPIENMRKGADLFARGELNHRLDPPATFELAALAEAMNQMAVELEQRIQSVIRRRNETQAVLASMVEGVVAVDSQERILHVNEAAARFFQQSAKQLKGRSIQELMRIRELHDMIRTTLEKGTKVEGDVILYQSGTQVLNTHCTPLTDADGAPIGVLLVMNDVTQLRRLENMRRDFAANVSHEIKTPLTAIRGFVETLLGGDVDDPEEIRRFMGIIEKHVRRLTAIIDDLMKLSHLEQDDTGEQFTIQSSPIFEVIDAAYQLCCPQADEKQISIAVECDEHLSAQMDKDLMEQAVVNLLDNAIKYSPPSSRIEIRAEQQAGEILICFRDQGVGIPRKHLPRLFERFYRVDRARSRNVGGTGLGLAIAKHIVQAHGGHIDVESIQGVGSTFTIYLPVDRTSDR